eukprot:4539890-Amphidinium_carterae.2
MVLHEIILTCGTSSLIGNHYSKRLVQQVLASATQSGPPPRELFGAGVEQNAECATKWSCPRQGSHESRIFRDFDPSRCCALQSVVCSRCSHTSTSFPVFVLKDIGSIEAG